MSLTIKLPENVYRYPYEFVGVAAYSAAAFAAASLPMPGMAQLIAIPAFAGLASLRAKGGLRIRKYRKNIRNLPYYALTPDQIPVSSGDHRVCCFYGGHGVGAARDVQVPRHSFYG